MGGGRARPAAERGWRGLNQLGNRNRGASSSDAISPPSSPLSSGSRPGLRAKEELDLCAALECAG